MYLYTKTPLYTRGRHLVFQEMAFVAQAQRHSLTRSKCRAYMCILWAPGPDSVNKVISVTLPPVLPYSQRRAQ